MKTSSRFNPNPAQPKKIEWKTPIKMGLWFSKEDRKHWRTPKEKMELLWDDIRLYNVTADGKAESAYMNDQAFLRRDQVLEVTALHYNGQPPTVRYYTGEGMLVTITQPTKGLRSGELVLYPPPA